MENLSKVKEFLLQVGPLRLMLLGICGVFLIFSSMPFKKTEPTKAEESTKAEEGTKENGNDAYIKKMEEKLEATLEKIQGVGKAQVMITLSSSRETVVNKDNPYEETYEEQEGDEKKSSRSASRQEETVLYEEDGDRLPYVVKEYEPQVEGVIAVVEGGEDPVVASAVTDAILALFHVEAHKIKVLKMEDGP